MDNTSIQIAHTILNQIKILDRYALMAWGAKRFISLPESKGVQGGVQFKVNGLTFKNWVRVELTWLDVYNVTFINTRGEVVKQFDDVYCDMLVDIIDWVENKHAA
ncbi:hypothetical protein [Seonamhaeicola maritimus]|uniref:Uncharacterized protein n=1 Tax=Seonamhaeicola maritimus TaxID=2591822 RepID=A0A5C7GGH0_9FLAO|nr:hypothetical protein [Seonamhaeicola maritimus]TXG36678.1 hypothetical protein FUA22_08835 [Seonamhaeicola maritimus]